MRMGAPERDGSFVMEGMVQAESPLEEGAALRLIHVEFITASQSGKHAMRQESFGCSEVCVLACG